MALLKPSISEPLTPRPKTIREAKKLILEVFSELDWDGDEQRRYFASIGVTGMETPEDIRAIITDFDCSKMVLFEEEKEK